MRDGEKDLDVLLRKMDPEIKPGKFVFCTLKDPHSRDLITFAQGVFREEEGFTLILPKQRAVELGVTPGTVYRRITLAVHSSLDAVGLLAEVTGVLAAAEISVNVCSAYFHDHLFVAEEEAQRAIKLLKALQARQSAEGGG